jgi:hypothetical protein
MTHAKNKILGLQKKMHIYFSKTSKYMVSFKKWPSKTKYENN